MNKISIFIISLSIAITGCNSSSENDTSSQTNLFIRAEIAFDDAQELVAYSVSLTNYLSSSNNNLSFTMNDAPVWLSLNDSGILSGTPSEEQVGEYNWQVSTNDDTATFSLTVLSTEAVQVAALAELTEAPAVYDENGDALSIDTESGDLQAIYFDALDYQGEATRVYAWIGIPSGVEAPMPAMVLVHGGGGSAYSEWVEKWNERGYAAISIAVEGQTDQVDDQGSWVEHQWAGPARTGIYNDANPERASLYVDVPDQWMYHAVADTVLANSLLRSLEVIDKDKIGVMGVSWGGVITSTVMGIDDRFSLAIPVYGCGHLYDAYNWWSNTLSYNSLYKSVWDPMVRMDKASMPSLWLSWSDDNNFGMDSFAYSYQGTAGEYMVSLIPDMGHGHASAWRPSDSYEFADSIFNNGTSWFKQTALTQDADLVAMNFTSSKVFSTYSLRYTTGTGFTGDLEWLKQSALLSENSDGSYSISATLPDTTTGWYFSLSDGDVYASSDYQENINLLLSPNDSLEIVLSASDTIASQQVEFTFSGPTNIEITDITVNDESHIGALSVDLEPPLVLDADTPSEIVTVSFDNSIAKLEQGNSTSAELSVTWEKLDASKESIVLPINIVVE